MRRGAQMFVGAALGSAILFGFSAQAKAAEGDTCPICMTAGDQQASYPSKAGCMLVRGATNTLLGWTELIYRPAREVKAGGHLFTGILHGIGQGVKRTVVGAGEVLTFWTPQVQSRYVRFAEDCPLCMGKK